MGTKLEIKDGNPSWWISPDIWVVPGDNPNGTKGSPIAGSNNYVWARVHNSRENKVDGARVEFFWSNPTTGVLRSNSTPIGSAFVDLDAGDSQEVLCITPWVPTIVNNGHECIVAQVIHPSDPLPNPLPDSFDPPSYRQVAQRNLTVLKMDSNTIIHIPIEISASKRSSKKVLLTVVHEPRTLKEEILDSIGLARMEPATKDTPLEVGFIETNSCENQNLHAKLEIDVPRGQRRAIYLKVRGNNSMIPGYYYLIHVVEHVTDRIVGGISFVISSHGGRKV